MPESTCFHCGLPVPANADFPIAYQNQTHPTCCAGCQAVAQSIISAGLDSYYRNRTAPAGQAELPPPEIMAQMKLYDLPEIQAEFVETLPENQKEAALMLGGITCAACVWLVEQRLLRCEGITRAELNYNTHRARIRWDESRIRLSDILSLIRKTGYTAQPYDIRKQEAARLAERKSMLVRLAVAALASMQTMMFALPTYLFADIEPQYLAMLHWGAFFMVLPAMFYAAFPFYQGAWRDLKNRRTGMDTPVALAVSLTFVAGVYALATRSTQGMYFESIAMFVFFLLAGRFMEHSARRKAGDAAERLAKLMPAFCRRLPDYPAEKTEETPVAAIRANDVLLVRAGETIPADGTVLSGESEADEAMLTGEHLPVPKTAGSRVSAGTLNTAAALVIRATETGKQTRLAHISRLLDRALSQKPRLAETAERYASGFTLGLIALALPTFLIWLHYTDAYRALWTTVSLLVITCPCALSLATPAALAASTDRLARSGILATGGQALENLAQITDAVFDKTGTLTQGRLSVSQVFLFGPSGETVFSGSLNETGQPESLPPPVREALAIAQLLEQQTEHPAAQAFFRLPHTTLPDCAIQERAGKIGQGVSARLTRNGKMQIWAIGKPAFAARTAGVRQPEMLAELAAQGSTVAALANQDGFQAAFLLQDQPKPRAADMLAELRTHGITLHLLSGDTPAAARTLADTLGIPNCRADASPEDKLAYVQALQAQGRRVLMFGDGINDAPVIAAADVSAAPAGSADVAREGADILLMQDDLMLLPVMLHQARRTRAVIRQNLLWASLYNAAAVPLAIAGLVTPWVAALGMSFSSLLVVGNALRLRKDTIRTRSSS